MYVCGRVFIHVLLYISAFHASYGTDTAETQGEIRKLVPLFEPRPRLPSQQIKLHYHERTQKGPHYAGVVTFDFRHMAFIVGQMPTLKSFKCLPSGIRLDFKSKALAEAARKSWNGPVLAIVRGREGSCAEDQDVYHPIRLASILPSHEPDSASILFVGYRSTWEVESVHHQVELFQINNHGVSSNSSQDLWNKGNQGNVPDLTILQSAVEQIVCRNCYLKSQVELRLNVSLPVYNPGSQELLQILKLAGDVENGLKEELGSQGLRGFQIIVDELIGSLQFFHNTILAITCAATELRERNDGLARFELSGRLDQVLNEVQLAVHGFQRLILGPPPTHLRAEVTDLERQLLKHSPSKRVRGQIIRLLKFVNNSLEVETTRTRESIKGHINLTNNWSDQSEFEQLFRNSSFPRHLLIELEGDMMLNAGLQASRKTAGKSKSDLVNFFSIGLVSLSIPKIIDISPLVKIHVNTSTNFNESGTSLVSAEAEWAGLNTSISFRTQSKPSFEHSYLSHRATHLCRTHIDPPSSLSADLRAEIIFELDLRLIKDRFSLGFGASLEYDTSSVRERTCVQRSFNITSTLETIVDPNLSHFMSLFDTTGDDRPAQAFSLRQTAPVDVFQECR
ncbi:hypothetical protein CROQUDRAFT_131191 [Cronartium quercuum f. sp. fusiforme G11]|uniref:Uncharacterized protein n=1 Tax=Cronartium quercuum f. sp. fusiforme G11 TaxID=708437 RepID=A0A9P6TF66_9BASI|nr:hypothetical protein CROQUDRAFT_131191 [Cronartium quercuum f. sp. fusiforme G11]